jgi:hypothetical protein
MAQAPTNPGQLNFELPADVEAVYSNIAVIMHSPSEIVIDFARVLPGAPNAKVLARVVMTPLNAKLLLKALQENIGKFEDKFGEVRMPSDTSFQAPDRSIGFKH